MMADKCGVCGKSPCMCFGGDHGLDIPVRILVQFGDDDPAVVARGSLPWPYDARSVVEVIKELGNQYAAAATGGEHGRG